MTSAAPPPFQPTLPARGATRSTNEAYQDVPHFNPRSPHGERLFLHQQAGVILRISTHAPRTGSDNVRVPLQCGRGRDFNPRSPHGERRVPHVGKSGNVLISTHAPRTGSDEVYEPKRRVVMSFQPTLPARGATHIAFNAAHVVGISTHAPRTGSDFR